MFRTAVCALSFCVAIASLAPVAMAAPQVPVPTPTDATKPEDTAKPQEVAQPQEVAKPQEAAKPQEPGKQPQQPKPSLVPEGAAGLDALQLARAMTSTMKLSMPGPQHEKLAALEGVYAVEMTLTPPGLPQQTCLGEARAMGVLSGRYLLVNLKVRVAAVVMEGLYVIGYDNLRSLYTVSWRDSLSTWAVECAGPVSDASPDVAALQGTMVDAASPTGRPFELVLGFAKDGFSLAVRDQVKGELAEVMRQTFVRKVPSEGAAPAEAKKAGETPRDK
jgi:hypothetical protein